MAEPERLPPGVVAAYDRKADAVAYCQQRAWTGLGVFKFAPPGRWCVVLDAKRQPRPAPGAAREEG